MTRKIYDFRVIRENMGASPHAIQNSETARQLRGQFQQECQDNARLSAIPVAHSFLDARLTRQTWNTYAAR